MLLCRQKWFSRDTRYGLIDSTHDIVKGNFICHEQPGPSEMRDVDHHGFKKGGRMRVHVHIVSYFEQRDLNQLRK